MIERAPLRAAGGASLESFVEGQRLRLALDAGGLGTWRWDLSAGQVEWDERLEQIFGFAPGEFDGAYETYVARLHPDERDAIQARVRQAVGDASAYDIEHRIVWPDGTVRWIQGRGDVTLDSAGSVTGTIGCVADISDRTRQALENAVLYETARTVASALQAGLAPTIPDDIPGVRVAVRYEAAGEGVDIGGDFYDFVAVAPDEHLLVVGDVCGRGPSAASLNAQVRFSARALARHGLRPAALADELNRTVTADAEDGRFCTAVFAAIKPGPPLRVEAVIAGHPSPIVLRAAGTMEALIATGPLLGVFDGASYRSVDIVLDVGDTLVVLTDGLLEARNQAGEFFEPRFLPLLAGLAGGVADEIAAGITGAVREFAGGPLNDDVALVVIQPG